MKLAGFIGTGKMGGALACAVIKKVGGENVMLSDHLPQKAAEIAGDSGAVCTTAQAVCESCKYVFLGVKPQVIAQTLSEIRDAILSRKDRVILVSMAAGVSMERICSLLGKEVPVIRIMPNTPAAVGDAMILYTANSLAEETEVSEFCNLLSLAGILDRLDEKLIDAGTAVSGCGPAFIYLVMQALADGGVKCGLPRDKALKYAEQTVLGAARLAIETGTPPEQLKDDVCSPGGATIEGVYALESAGVRGAVMQAVKAAYEKSKKL